MNVSLLLSNDLSLYRIRYEYGNKFANEIRFIKYIMGISYLYFSSFPILLHNYKITKTITKTDQIKVNSHRW